MNDALKQIRREASWQKFKRRQARRKSLVSWLKRARPAPPRWLTAAVKDFFSSAWAAFKFLWPGLLVYYVARFYGESETLALIAGASVLTFLLVRDEIVRPLREVRALLQAQEVSNRPRPQ
jgi:hypothetical protein